MRKELIELLREEATLLRDSGFPVTPHLMKQAAMLEADAVPPGYGWLTACDEEMICYHLGVANLSDSYESAKRKLRALIDLNVAIATDPAINGGMSLQPIVPQEPVAILNHAHGVHAIRSVNIAGLPDGEYKLYTAPQPQPRLTDGEVYTAYIEATNQTLRPQDERLAFAFARAIEKKVRGEA